MFAETWSEAGVSRSDLWPRRQRVRHEDETTCSGGDLGHPVRMRNVHSGGFIPASLAILVGMSSLPVAAAPVAGCPAEGEIQAEKPSKGKALSRKAKRKLKQEQLRREQEQAACERDALVKSNEQISEANRKLSEGKFAGAIEGLKGQPELPQKLSVANIYLNLSILRGEARHLDLAESIVNEIKVAGSGGAPPLLDTTFQPRLADTEQGIADARAAIRAHRRGSGELIAGGVMGGVFLTSAAFLARALAYRAATRKQLENYEMGGPQATLDGLRAIEGAADTQIAASAVIGAFSLVLAATLLSLGARDHRRLRKLQVQRFQ